MRRRNVATAIGFAGFALIVVALVGSLGAFVYGEMGAMRQRDALNLLNYFQQAMVTKLYDEVSPVDDLAAAFEVDPDDEAWFPRVAGELLEREEVSYVAYVRGDTMAYAYPEEEFGDTVGDDLASFSYVYTLAKWTDGFVVESSVELSSGENVFLFVRPVNVGGSYYGEAVVGVKESYVLEQLDFASLEEAGYLYELWSVSPQDGSKDVIAASGGSHDFSHAAKSTFNMPTQWTLSIMPEQGWIPREWSIFLAAGVIAVEALIFGLAFVLLAYRAFVDELERSACRDEAVPLTIVCLMVDGFEHAALSLGPEARRSYLESVKGEIDEVIQVQHVAARVSAGCFAIVIRDYVDRGSLVDLMRALELALMWKVRIDGKKAFCAVRSAAVRFPEDGDDPVALVERTVSLLERDRPGR